MAALISCCVRPTECSFQGQQPWRQNCKSLMFASPTMTRLWFRAGIGPIISNPRAEVSNFSGVRMCICCDKSQLLIWGMPTANDKQKQGGALMCCPTIRPHIGLCQSQDTRHVTSSPSKMRSARGVLLCWRGRSRLAMQNGCREDQASRREHG